LRVPPPVFSAFAGLPTASIAFNASVVARPLELDRFPV
jgi:hypothetical protein